MGFNHVILICSFLFSFTEISANEGEFRSCLERQLYVGQIEANSRDHVDSKFQPFTLVRDKQAEVVVVLVHAMGKSPALMRQLGQAFFNRDANVVVPILEGHGTSRAQFSKFLTNPELAQKKWEENLVASLRGARALGKKTVLVGYSIGAVESLIVSLKHPELVDALVLNSPAFEMNKVLLRITNKFVQQWNAWNVENSEAILNGKVKHEENPFISAAFNNKRHWSELPEFDEFGYSTQVTAAIPFTEYVNLVLKQKLDSNHKLPPTLIMFSDHDKIIDVTAAKKIVEKYKLGESFVLSAEDNTTHEETFSGAKAVKLFDHALEWVLKKNH